MSGPELGDTPWRRSPEELQAGLTAWAEALRGAQASHMLKAPARGCDTAPAFFDEARLPMLSPA